MDQLVKNVPARWVENLPNPRIGPRSPTLQADSPGEGKGYPLQCSGLENPMDYIVHRVAKSQIRLSSDFHFPFTSLSMITSAFLGTMGLFTWVSLSAR